MSINNYKKRLNWKFIILVITLIVISIISIESYSSTDECTILTSHVYDQKVVDEKFKQSDATCQSPAIYYKSCVCGAKGSDNYTFEYGELNPIAHKENKDENGDWIYPSLRAHPINGTQLCRVGAIGVSTCLVPGCEETLSTCTISDTEVRERHISEGLAELLGLEPISPENEGTCTKEGNYINKIRCTACGDADNDYVFWYGEYIRKKEPNKHNYETIEAVEAGCCSGNIKYLKCVDCKKIFDFESKEEIDYEDTIIPGDNNHNFIVSDRLQGTCSQGGIVKVECHCKKGVFYCTECPDEIVIDPGSECEILYTIDPRPATCTQYGILNEVKVCKYCSSRLEENKVEPLGHDMVKHDRKEPTCLEEGKIEYWECNRCRTAFKDEAGETPVKYGESTLPKTEEHTPGKPIRANIVEATCTTDGSYEEVVYCTVCKKEMTRQTITVDAIGHTPGEAVKENEVEATCAVAGSYEEVVYCTECNEEISRTTKTIEKINNHTQGTAVKENVVGAICDAAGSYDKVIYCTVCKKEMSRQKITVDAIGHTPGESVRENEIAATCAVVGSYEEVVYCTVCNAEISRTTKTIEKLTTHTEEVVQGKAATCTETGLTEGKKCSVCGEITVAQEEIPALGHNFGEWVIEKEATYEEEGLKYRVCTNCNEERQEEVIPKLPKEEVTITTTHTVKEIESIKYIEISETIKLVDFLKNITSNSEIIVKDKDGNVLNSNSKIATGAKVITKEDGKEQYTVILKGDINCDGEITFRDIINANAIRINGENNISKAQLFAADLNNTNKIEFRDIIMLNAIRINAGK